MEIKDKHATVEDVGAAIQAYTRINTSLALKSNLLIREDGEYKYLGQWMNQSCTGEIYGVKFPLYETSTATTGVKILANQGLVLEASTNTYAGQDDYEGKFAFWYKRVNATVDEDGVPHVTAIEGDLYFDKYGANGDVWSVHPIMYTRVYDEDGWRYYLWSDVKHDGFTPIAGSQLPDGTMRPYILIPAYFGTTAYNGVLSSVADQPYIDTSYNGYPSLLGAKGLGYSGWTMADMSYVRWLHLMMLGDKNSQNYCTGCVSSLQTTLTLDATGDSIVVPNTFGNWVEVGMPLVVGSDNRLKTKYRVRSVETYDTDNKRIYLNDVPDEGLSVAAGLKVQTAPWFSGACDDVQGRLGSPWSNTNQKDPYVINGIEMSIGVNIVQGNSINVTGDGSDGAARKDMYIFWDAMKRASTVTDDAEFACTFYENAAGTWTSRYTADVSYDGGVLQAVGAGSGSSTGTGDYQYVYDTNPSETLSCGAASRGLVAGVFCADSVYALSLAVWSCGARLSALGRSAKPSGGEDA